MKPLIIANWKCNPDTVEQAVLLAKNIEEHSGNKKSSEVVVAPPFVFLAAVGSSIRKIKLGAQDVFWEGSGPYTGEISWRQLKYFKIKYVIVGHSERRVHLGETNEAINKKVLALLGHDMNPVLCLGEDERTGDIAKSLEVQLRKALSGARKNQLKNLVVTYEPIWAISTNLGSKPDTPDNAFRVSLHIRKVLTAMFDRNSADKVKIIYGGSVNSNNVASFIKEGRMQGVLVGGASIDAVEFNSLINAVSLISRLK